MTAAIQERLQNDLEQAGYPARIISATHLEDLKQEISALLDSGTVQKSLYQEGLDRWKYDYTSECPEAKSLIVVAMPQPIIKIRLFWQGQRHDVIIPPTYNFKMDRQVIDLIETVLEPEGYQIKRAAVPQKLLAVRSGLSEYGRNNISYIDGFGSYYRLLSFVSDIPCTQDSWHAAKVMQACDNCQACIKSCPTQAINPERFVINIDKCLTFWNESDTMPDWVDRGSHNALVGCLRCQKICPQNIKHEQVVIMDQPFSEEELALILDNTEMDQLPEKVVNALKDLNLDYLYREKLLARNLSLLLDKDEQ